MTILAKNAQGKGGPDVIFAYAGAAAQRAQEVGKKNIINATIGAFLDANGDLKTMNTVEDAIKSVPFGVGANYAPIDGTPSYIEAMTDSVLRENRPANVFTGGIATPGGTGALHNSFYNYLNEGETCLTTSYYWGNYDTLLEEDGRHMRSFNMFTPEGAFDFAACEAACKELAEEQTNVMLLLNTPAHNPTGYSITDEEWHHIIDMLTAIANNGKNNVVLILDVAYLDYAGDAQRKFLSFFTGLPENFLPIVCASASKGYTLYGYRIGLQFCLAQSEAMRDEFVLANGASARGTWSNCSRVAMEAITDINADSGKQAAFRAEQAEFAASLSKRSKVFMKEAEEVGLEVCPYQSGFFIFVPTRDHDEAEAVYELLQKKDFFPVPLGDGLRVAICAVDDAQIPGMAKMFKDAIDMVRE